MTAKQGLCGVFLVIVYQYHCCRKISRQNTVTGDFSELFSFFFFFNHLRQDPTISFTAKKYKGCLYSRDVLFSGRMQLARRL